MRQQMCAGVLLVSGLLLTVNCGSDDSGNGGGDTTDSGGSGGSDASGGSSSGGSSSGGSSSGGSSSGGSSSGGSSSGGSSSGGSSSGGSSSGGSSSGGSSSGGSAGDGSAGDGGDNGDLTNCPDDIEEMPTRLARLICEKRTSCCTDSDTSSAACLTEVQTALEEIYPDLEASEEAGTASLDCNAFEACAVAIADASCDEWPLQAGSLGGLPVDEPACLEVITPTAGDGDDCSYNYECIDGLCRVPEDETVGSCDEFANLNASCDDTCNPVTMFCNDANVCQARLPNGAACTEDEQCQSRICDVGGSDECVAPGPDECEYVPNGAAHCALGGAPGSRQAPYGSLALMLLAGVATRVVRRRGAPRRPASSD